jgi:hypothetical protein
MNLCIADGVFVDTGFFGVASSGFGEGVGTVVASGVGEEEAPEGSGDEERLGAGTERLEEEGSPTVVAAVVAGERGGEEVGAGEGESEEREDCSTLVGGAPSFNDTASNAFSISTSPDERAAPGEENEGCHELPSSPGCSSGVAACSGMVSHSPCSSWRASEKPEVDFAEGGGERPAKERTGGSSNET